MDEYENGRQDAWEVGVGGICIHLFDAENGERLASTSSDSNGCYGFGFTMKNTKNAKREETANLTAQQREILTLIVQGMTGNHNKRTE